MDIYQWVLSWWGPWGTAARWGVAAFNEMNALPLAVAVAVGNLALLAVTPQLCVLHIVLEHDAVTVSDEIAPGKA
jgi:hypothetical protein